MGARHEEKNDLQNEKNRDEVDKTGSSFNVFLQNKLRDNFGALLKFGNLVCFITKLLRSARAKRLSIRFPKVKTKKR